MSRKVNIQELSALLAEKAGIATQEAEVFLREYFDTMGTAIVEDRLLKVKNIGTFKLVLVDDRASVDIATGERQIIPAHYKVSYTPDTRLSETVNEPFAMFESVELTVDSGEVTIDSGEVTVDSGELTVDNGEVRVESEEMEENEDEREPDAEPHFSTRRRKKKKRVNWFAIVSVLLLLAMAAVVFFVYLEDKRLSRDDYFIYPDSSYNKAENTVTRSAEPQAAVAESVREPEAPPAVPPKEEPKKEEPAVKETPKVTPAPPKEEPKPAQPTAASSTSKTRVLKSGETLRLIAEQELGSRDFWVYVYLKNKDKIKNPNVVSAGTTLAIPAKSEYGGINASDPESIKRARNEAAKVK